MPKPPPHPVEATPDPHYRADGKWFCHSCLRPLVLDHGEPIIPWQHQDVPSPKAEKAVEMPGLGTTE